MVCEHGRPASALFLGRHGAVQHRRFDDVRRGRNCRARQRLGRHDLTLRHRRVVRVPRQNYGVRAGNRNSVTAAALSRTEDARSAGAVGRRLYLTCTSFGGMKVRWYLVSASVSTAQYSTRKLPSRFTALATRGVAASSAKMGSPRPCASTGGVAPGGAGKPHGDPSVGAESTGGVGGLW